MIKGFTCSSFDLLHAGHMLMLQDCKNVCDYLVVGLQTDPTIDRPDSKNKPIQSLRERFIMVQGCEYVDEIWTYETEEQLLEHLKMSKYDIRILGSDWEGKKYTGEELNIPIHFHKRDHDWSTTNLRKRIQENAI